MIAILFVAVLAAPPELPADADFSDRLLAEWMYAEKLEPAERANVVRLTARWERWHDDWLGEQSSRIFAAMEATWACAPGSAKRDAAADAVRQLQSEKIERWNAFVGRVRLLVKRRGDWPTEWASHIQTSHD